MQYSPGPVPLTTVSDGDATVMKCILDLHTGQDSACVGVQGCSREGPNTGISYGQCSSGGITAQDSKAMQGAVDDITGMQIQSDEDLALYHFYSDTSSVYTSCFFGYGGGC